VGVGVGGLRLWWVGVGGGDGDARVCVYTRVRLGAHTLMADGIGSLTPSLYAHTHTHTHTQERSHAQFTYLVEVQSSATLKVMNKYQVRVCVCVRGCPYTCLRLCVDPAPVRLCKGISQC
jgi:hypothetical protein